ncbi:hypothetical protein PACILC2_25820 [Paenibacillus cisolokensis]|uniref:SLH domain-containing protein n=1 Tax=Paenibacillus cisolokensis TaxID=1658519 RepID=A0ABQ4N704_9BACL|nr:S-layer homology domain-containing protein [Paenibacillus cisolokensis]GIQ64014.1 hypothetical protein PACILC2_25820 [Paenibacillus cisolokensis]
MKKSLSLLVAIAMVFSMFASMASAAELTTQQKFDALKEAGIFTGYPDGSAGLENDMTRAEFAKVLALLNGLDLNNAKATYSDVSANHWARAHIGAVSDAGLMNGIGGGKFGPTIVVTVEQLAKTIVLSSGLQQSNAEVKGTVSNWAKGYVAAAIEAGFIPELSDYTANATRGQLVDASYEVFVQKHKTTITKAAQTGAKTITVEFSKALTDDQKKDLTFEVKRGLTPVNVTSKFAEDNKSVALTAAYLPAGDYTVTVKGFDPASVKVEEERATKLEITAPALTINEPGQSQELGVVVSNQFGEKMQNATPQISVYNNTKGQPIDIITNSNGGRVDLYNKAAINDDVTVTAIYPAAGLSATKVYKVINGSAATVIKIGEVKPLEGKERISVNETGLILPLELTTATGQTIKLPTLTKKSFGNQNYLVHGGLYIYVSDTRIITDISVDSNGVVKFSTGDQSGIVNIMITNPATAASASATITVAGKAQVKEFQLQHPGVQIVQGEEVTFPFVAVDSFGKEVKGSDINLAESKIQFISGLTFTHKLTAKGELKFTFTQAGTTTITTIVNGIAQPNPITLTVEPTSKDVRISGFKDVANVLEVGAENNFGKDNILKVDNYGREGTAKEDSYEVKSSNTSVVEFNGTKLIARGAGTAVITVSLKGVDYSSYEREITVVNSSDIKSYEIQSIGTLYKTKDERYQKQVKVNGKLANGTVVKLANENVSFATSSNPSVVAVNNGVLTGVNVGKSTISAVVNGIEVPGVEVTVSDEAPAAKTVKFKKDEYEVQAGHTIDFADELEVKDQYGVELPKDGQIYVTANSGVATVVGKTSVQAKADQAGKFVTLTYYATNGVSATTTLVVK